MSQTIGHISQIIGPVIDVYFDTKGEDSEKVLPKIYEALRVKRPDGRDLIIEVQQHVGEDTVRCVAMDNTDGLQRGLEAMRTGSPITMPAGRIWYSGRQERESSLRIPQTRDRRNLLSRMQSIPISSSVKECMAKRISRRRPKNISI